MQTYSSSFQGAALRATRLNSTGAPTTGATGAYQLTGGFIRVQFTPEYEAGDEFLEKNAQGGICAYYKQHDVLKNVQIELEICEPDVEFTELINGGTLLTVSAQNGGYALPAVGVDSNVNGSALEVWSYRVANGSRLTTLPYYRWVFPYVQLRLTGDRVIENGRLATVFSGFGLGNSSFGTGPAHDWAYTSASAYQYAQDSAAPSVVAYITV